MSSLALLLTIEKKNMEDRKKKAFDFASDTTKQIISLSTGILALSVTFSEELLGDTGEFPKNLLIGAWVIFIISIFFGLLTQMTLTGTLDPREKYKEKTSLSINNWNIKIFSICQVIFFFIAIIITVLFGYQSLRNSSLGDSPVENRNEYQIIRKSIINTDSTTIFIDTLYFKK